MKTFCLTIVIVVVLLSCSNGIQAQITLTKLNQVELMKQFVGAWKSEMFQDTIWSGEIKSFGTGLEGYFKAETKGKVVIEQKQLMGYDKKTDKFIETDLYKGSGIIIYTIWFASKNKATELPYEFITNPEKTPSKWDIDFKSADQFTETYTQNNKVIAVYTFNRDKK